MGLGEEHAGQGGVGQDPERLGPTDRFGLRTLIARTTAGDVARIDALVAHLADLLAAAGDTDPTPVRRATAFGLLANPALACVFLAHAHPTQTSTETEPEPVAPSSPSSRPSPPTRRAGQP